MEIPKRIIEKYRGVRRNEFIFPVPTNATCNTHISVNLLKRQKSLQNKSNLSHGKTYFGTMFLTEGVPLESLSKMMGHKNISTTQIYAKITSQKISKDMDLVTPKFKAMEEAFLIQMESEEIELLNEYANTDEIYNTEEVLV
jgi:integrase